MICSGSLVPGVDPSAFGLPAGTALRYERPADALNGLVASYAVLDSDPAIWTGPDSWLLPGWAQLWFKLTEGTVTVRTRKRRPLPLGAAMLYGPTLCAMPVTSQGGVTIVVDLTPAGWARWIDAAADTLRDQIVPLERFWAGDTTDAAIARLHASDRGPEVKAILDDLLLSRLPPPHPDEPIVAKIAALVSDPDLPSARAAADAIGVSPSTLLRLSNRHFGFPPKVLARRTRFLRVMTDRLMREDAPDHRETPAGYHDVSHFLRDANTFLGITPRQFLALPMPYLRAVLRARTMVIGAPWPMLD